MFKNKKATAQIARCRGVQLFRPLAVPLFIPSALSRSTVGNQAEVRVTTRQPNPEAGCDKTRCTVAAQADYLLQHVVISDDIDTNGD